MPDLIAIAQNLPPEFYATVFAALGITLLVEKFKKWLEREQEKREWIYVLISTTLAFMAAVGHYVASGGGQEWTVLGQHTGTVLGAITLIYHFPKVGVKALHQTVADAQALRQLKATGVVTIPAEPIVQTPLRYEQAPLTVPVRTEAPVVLDNEF